MNNDAHLQQALYRSMRRIRLIEQAIAREYKNQEMRCPVHLSIGQEVAAAAVCESLTRHDYVFSGHRSHAHYLAKGGDLKKMIAELYGKATGCSQGFGGSMHLTDIEAGFIGATPIVGSSIPIAVGAALTIKQRNLNKIVVVFLGDGAMETGAAHESMNFAAVHQLPILFVCENNLYSVYSPLSIRQPAGRGLCELAKSHGLTVESVMGDDALSVFHRAAELISLTRKTSQPSFLEVAVYRWVEHCGPDEDDCLGYRPQAEIEAWRNRDALKQLEEAIVPENKTALKKAIAAEIDVAFDFAKSSSFPNADDLGRYVYAKNKSATLPTPGTPSDRFITYAEALNEGQAYAWSTLMACI